MSFWRRRQRSRSSGSDPEPRAVWRPKRDVLGQPYVDSDPDGEGLPVSFEPNGPAKLYEDEIDPEWADPLTEDEDLYDID